MPKGISVRNLSGWREQRLLTQDELAQKAKVSRGTIIRVERGEPVTLENIRKIARALKITPEQLIYEDAPRARVIGSHVA